MYVSILFDDSLIFSSYKFTVENSGSFLSINALVGLLGSFTTFSAFSYEAINLIMTKKIFVSFIYIFFSISVCILSAYLGMIINK